MRPGILAKLSCLPAIACVSAAIAGVNTWTMTGPDAGASTALAMHPTNTQIAIVATPRGLYRTANGGGSWTLVNEYLRSSMNSIAFDPANPNRVFAANGKLWRSNDAGLTFAVVTEPSGDRIDNVAFSSAGVLYAHAGTGQIYKSVNQGSTWSTCGLPGGVVGASTVFAVDPNPNPQDHLFIEM